jgi:hypothetical protein
MSPTGHSGPFSGEEEPTGPGATPPGPLSGEEEPSGPGATPGATPPGPLSGEEERSGPGATPPGPLSGEEERRGQDLINFNELLRRYSPEPLTHVPLSPETFRPGLYTFTLDSIEIDNTRSSHEDTDYVSVSVAVGDQPTQTAVKALGDLNNGTYPVGLSVGPLSVDKPDVGVAFNYIVVNAGHTTWAQVSELLQEAGDNAASAAMGDAGKLSAGSITGSIVTPAAAWLVHQIEELWIADCDGPVAAEEVVFEGSQLWALAGQGPYTHRTFHPGLDSPAGCGSNSRYWATWIIERA